MSRGLRYLTEADLPPGVRLKVASEKLRNDDVEKDWREAGAIKRKKPRRDQEHQQQVNFFLRLASLAINEPRFAAAVRRTHAIPNGGGRSKAEGGRLKAEGVRKGVPDIFCAMPQGPFHGLWIEMKSREGRVSDEQHEWLVVSRQLGYAGAVCRSADEAYDLWRTYNAGCELPATEKQP